MERRTRLGDVIDDYCTRCGLIMNHGVVGMVGDEVRMVRCNTCMSEHVYKHARLPKRKRDQTAKLFDEVLRGLGRKDAGEPAAPDATPEEEAPAAATAEADAAGRNGATEGPETAAPEPAASGTTASAPAPDDREREGVEAHRRKLYTIRRHSGGRPPGTGTPHR
jgi:hypothetical protein